MVFVSLFLLSSGGGASTTVALVMAFFGLIGVIIFFANRGMLRKRAKLYKFANANGITTLFDRADPPYAGMIFSSGHTRKVIEALSFVDGVEIGNYKYVTGSGRSRSEHSWGYVRIPLSRQLPHMVLDAKKNNIFKTFTNLPGGFTKDQILQLEGNFNDYFTLYAPKQYEQDAFYVFTPDVMAALIDFGAQYDVEIIDNNLVLYSSNHLPIYSKQYLEGLFTVIGKIGSELRDQTRRYADERVGDKTMNIVAAPGKRLKPGLTAGAIITFVLIVIWFVGRTILEFM